MKQSVANKNYVSLKIIATELNKVTQKTATNNPYGFAYYKEANWWETNHSDSRDNFTRISEKFFISLALTSLFI